MKKSNYQQAKTQLRLIAGNAKLRYRKDKPAIRQIINDSADSLSREMNLSNYESDLLANYACILHPKN